MRPHTKSLLLALPLLLTVAAHPQQPANLLAVSIGGEFIPSNALASTVSGPRPIDYASSLVLEFNYGRRVLTRSRAALWLEVPTIVGPNHKIANGNALLPTSLATLYVTPSARIAFPISHRYTPWLSFGGGYGLFETSDAFQGGAPNPNIHAHTGVLQFGAGVDAATPIHIFAPIGLRASFRDFYALKTPTSSSPQPPHPSMTSPPQLASPLASSKKKALTQTV